MQATDRRHITRQSSQSGFTLIELLVVISIISILIAILLPALAKARMASRTAVCLSQERQLGQIHYIYTQDYDGYIISHDGQWVRKLMGLYLYDNFNNAYAKIIKEKSIGRCPVREFSNDEYEAMTGTKAWTLYGMNYVRLHTWTPKPAKFDDIPKPSNTIFMADSRGTTSDSYRLINAAWSTAYPSLKHNDAGNVLWCDGHASTVAGYELSPGYYSDIWKVYK
ncbi:MAG: prepilin-type N-terminal cleavage/methylation domain-containing protein [Phycisphaeraceae bacterium JB051]